MRKQPAPYKPIIRYPTDTSNFDPVELERQLSNTSNYLHNYENNDYMPKSSDQHNCSTHKENGSKRKKDKKIPEHAFFEFTFRRFFDEEGTALPIICLNTDININADGTLKLIKNSNSTNRKDDYSTEENEDQSGGEEGKKKEENTEDAKKDVASVYV